MLDYYSQEIAGLPDSGIPTSSDISDLYSSWENIAPIMTTKWNQSAPYNNACPTIGSRHCYTGCVATAMAQVVRSNGFAHPSGYKSYVPPKVNKTVSFDYSSASFDPSLMPDICGPNTPAGQSEAVALLMLACGVSVSMDYGTDESGAYTDEVANALIKYFGYDSGTRFYSRDRFNTAQWEEFVYTELQLGRPLVYSGRGGSKGHAFVVDGYKCPGLFHVNWEWGGLSDGYFALTALNPSKQGIGSSGQGGYNYVQGAIAALRPGDAPGKSFLSMAGSLKHVGPGKYDVYFQSLGEGNIGITLGAVIIDSNGKVMAGLPFWTDNTLHSTGTLYFNGFPFDFSLADLEPGDYRIYPAFARKDEDSYMITERFSERQYYVNLTVTADGEYIYTNSRTGGHELHISDIEMQDAYSGYSADASISLVNNGIDDFIDELKVVLSSEKGTPDPVCGRTVDYVAISGGQNGCIKVALNLNDGSGNPMAPGTYYLTVTDTENVKIAPEEITVEVIDDIPPQTPQKDIYVYNTDEIPAVAAGGRKWPHKPQISNSKEQPVRIEASFYRPGTNSTVKYYVIYEGSLSTMSGNLPAGTFTLDIPYGVYEMAYTNHRDEISKRSTVTVGEESDGIFYAPFPRDAESTRVVSMTERNFDEDIRIPESISISGSNRTVTAIFDDAFFNCDSITSIDLPATINKIGRNAISYCRNLAFLFLRSPEPPFAYRNHVALGMNSDTEIYVPATGYDRYRDILGNRNPVYSIIETIESGDHTVSLSQDTITVAINPPHPAVNPDFSITPVANGLEPAAEASVAGIDSNGNLMVAVKAHHSGTSFFEINSSQPGIEPARVTVTIPESAAIDGIETDADKSPAVYYDLNGRPVGKQNLRKGQIYIVTRAGQRGATTITVE